MMIYALQKVAEHLLHCGHGMNRDEFCGIQYSWLTWVQVAVDGVQRGSDVRWLLGHTRPAHFQQDDTRDHTHVALDRFVLAAATCVSVLASHEPPRQRTPGNTESKLCRRQSAHTLTVRPALHPHERSPHDGQAGRELLENNCVSEDKLPGLRQVCSVSLRDLHGWHEAVRGSNREDAESDNLISQ